MLRYVLILLLVGPSCSLPHDPKDTLERIRGDTLLVGIAHNPPWTDVTRMPPGGVETAFAQELADTLGAHLIWRQGGAEDLLQDLEHYQLDLVIGGFTNTSPWKKRVALTKPYFTETYTVGAPASGPAELEGLHVGVRRGSSLAAFLDNRDAIPVPLDSLQGAGLPVAAPAWELEALGLVPSSIELHKARHVVAAPPGENAWLVFVDRFMQRRSQQVAARLNQEVQP